MVTNITIYLLGMSSPLLVKFSVLAVKTITKPLAKALKNKAAANPQFNETCIRIGNAKNWIPYKWNQMVGDGTKTYTRINDNVAVYYGSEILSEAIVFGVGGAAIYWEIHRKNKSSSTEMDNVKYRLDVIENHLGLSEDQ